MEPVKALFVPFTKVDAVRREVSGIVTAESPDKDHEVCDYQKSVPYYRQVIQEIGKATGGENFFPLREMHQMRAVGKCIGFNFNDSEREIEMTFKVVDDDAWKKVEERVYTGFSQGGRKVGDQVPDPIHKGCMRYVASPSEVSLVDNPCLPTAHFAYVKSDGSVEMRKFLKVEEPRDSARLAQLEEEVNTLMKAAGTQKPAAQLAKEKKTKRVSGEDLSSSAFAYVGDPEKTETWKLPIRFSNEAKTKSHIRNALARFNQTQGIPASDKADVLGRIKRAARQHGIDVSQESDKMATVLSVMRKAVRIYVNRNLDKIESKNLRQLDSELGKLAKGMNEVSRLAYGIDNLASLAYSICMEQEWEGDDDSQLPEMLAENVEALAQTLVAMVDEESRELVDELQARVA